jgi:hypothetical protein
LPGASSSGYRRVVPGADEEQPEPAQALAWSPRWYLWDGGFLAVGRSQGIIPPHAHHAIQIVLGLDGTPRIKGAAGEWRLGRGIIVPPNAVHSFVAFC